MPYSLRRSAEKLCERSGSEKTRAMEKTKARRDGKAARAERAKKRSALREAKKARRKALCAERRTGLEDLLKKARKRATAHGESEFGKRRFASPLFSRRFAFPTDICPFPLAFCCMSRDSFPTKKNRLLRGRRFAAANAPRTPVRRRTVRDNGEARKGRDKPFTGEFSGISRFPRTATARMSVFYKSPFLFRAHRKRR